MSNELQKQTELISYTPEQVALIKTQIAPKATDNELKLFLYQCQRTGLDALSRQIYCIHLGNKMTIQTSIDGFRVVAERSGTYAGQDEPIWEEGANNKPTKCTVKVYRFNNGQRYCAGVGVAYWNEYAQSSPMWNKMPHTMLAKCAEALALRKAFPQDLSGLYTGDEMEQAQSPNIPYEPANSYQKMVLDEDINDVPTKEERALLKSLVYNSDLTEEEQEKAFESIDTCTNYKKFEAIQMRLESRKKPLDQIINPTQKDISNHIKQFV